MPVSIGRTVGVREAVAFKVSVGNGVLVAVVVGDGVRVLVGSGEAIAEGSTSVWVTVDVSVGTGGSGDAVGVERSGMADPSVSVGR